MSFASGENQEKLIFLVEPWRYFELLLVFSLDNE